MRTQMLFAVLAGFLVVAEQSVWAQATPAPRGTTGSATSLGVGSNMFGTASGGGAGGGGMGASGFGSSFGSAGGQSGFGQSGLGQAGGQSGFGQAGQAGAGNNSFLGANTSGSFIGRATQGQTGNFNAGNQNRGANNRGGGGQNQNLLSLLTGGGGNQGGQTSTAPAIRPRQKVAFDFPKPSPTRIQASYQKQLTGISRRYPQFQNIDLAPGAEGEVVLTGTVPTARDARLAANLARLEPGVRTVRNELQFPPETATE